jgi:signal transduction histidine kinase
MAAGLHLRLAVTFGGIQAAAYGAVGVLSEPVEVFAVETCALAVTVAGAGYHARRIGALTGEVTAFARRLAEGHHGERVALDGPSEFAELGRSVNEMAVRLEREAQARANFIGKVSHELRTPLTVIKGYVYTLRRGQRDGDTAAKLDVIDGECERLAYLIEDLLELARAQAGELRVSAETFPLRECVAEVAERMRAVGDQRQVGIDFAWHGNGSLVMGDENRVRQIFANLLTNGIKYAPPGTTVAVRGESAGADLRVTVEDAGRGIAEADLPFIFEEFYRSPDRSEPGAGLGLAVARELALAHGGAIEVRSAVGLGTAFTVTLPAWREI